MRKITIAIDGHSSCGKSTLAKDLAEAFGYLYIDSGAMYRAVTLYLLEGGIELSNETALQTALSNIQIDFTLNSEGKQDTLLNGKVRTEEIRTSSVNKRVSQVAANSQIRKHLVAQQKHFGQEKAIVMDGRDIGTVVFPNAELKIFLTADIEIRAQRRYHELQIKGFDTSIDEVRSNLNHRDHIDSTRDDSPLIIADSAIVIDNSNLTRSEQLEMTKALALCRMGKNKN